MRRRACLGALALALAACTSPVRPASAPSSSGPSPSIAPSPAPSFSGGRALAVTRELSERFPRREATTPTYRAAAAYVVRLFERAGYTVERQRVPVPAGTVDGTPVRAGVTLNVIARPAGFDPARPWVVVGAHLDSVPDTPGANDNGSGVAVVVEASRLAAAAPPPTQVVFVAFGAEERRIRGDARFGALFGSRAFVRELSGPERASLRGAIVVDMVGNGDRVLVVGTAEDPMTRRVLAVARAERIPFRRTRVDQFFSDNVSFRAAGISVAWLWAGNHPSLHTPRDTIAVVERDELGRVGTLLWETLRRVRI